MVEEISFIKESRTVHFGSELQVKVQNRHAPVQSDLLIFRMIGISGLGTCIFDLKNDKKVQSKPICRVNSDFIASFINNMTTQ